MDGYKNVVAADRLAASDAARTLPGAAQLGGIARRGLCARLSKAWASGALLHLWDLTHMYAEAAGPAQALPGHGARVLQVLPPIHGPSSGASCFWVNLTANADMFHSMQSFMLRLYGQL